MEPCLFRHGKGNKRDRYCTVLAASMEPCLFRHGKLAKLDEIVDGADWASMEPCLFRHGKHRPGQGRHPQPPASMEPCLFRHGKGARITKELITHYSLQWSHVFSDMVREFYWANLMVEPDKLQWSHVFSDMVSPAVRHADHGSGRFNGAMSFQTW